MRGLYLIEKEEHDMICSWTSGENDPQGPYFSRSRLAIEMLGRPPRPRRQLS